MEMEIKKICPYCNKPLSSEKEIMEHAIRHARRFYNPHFCPFEEVMRHIYAAIWMHGKNSQG